MPSATSAPENATAQRLTAITLVLVLGVITTLLDTTIVNIALDHLTTAFDASISDAQWVVTAYLLAYVAAIPVSGWASDRFGSRRVWMFSVATFLVGSLLCGISPSLWFLVAFRIVQGVGGGLVMPVTITILTRAAGKERIGQAIATLGFVGQLAPIMGPLIGGSILDSIGWRWLFFVNLPICLAALVLAPRFLPAGQKSPAHTFDIVGFLLLTPGVVAVAYGVSQTAGVRGFTATGSWLPIAIGAALVAAFAVYSLRTTHTALIDVRIFARRSFGLSSVITFVSGFSLYALMFLLPLFYQQLRGNSVFVTGLLLVPQGIGAMCFILLNKQLTGRLDTRLVIAGGVLSSMIGILPFALSTQTGGDALLLVGQFLLGFGNSAVALPVMTLAFTGLGHEETSRGSAAFSIVQRVGAPFGVTVIAVLLQTYLTGSHASQEGLLRAYNITFWWVLILSAIPLALAVLIKTPRRSEELGGEL